MSGYENMPDLVKRQYAQNKLTYETAGDKNSDIVKNAQTANEQFRSIYGINSDDQSYRSFTDNYANGGLRDNANKYMRKLGNTYQPRNQSQLRQDADAVRNFQYNPDSDPNFKAYADMYARQGRAAQDGTYSNLTALSGGRNNSWASAATAQVGQAYAKKATDMIPQLAETAYNRLLQRYNISRDEDNTDYSRYNDQWQRDRDSSQMWYDRYDRERQDARNAEAYARQMRNDDFEYESGVMKRPHDMKALINAGLISDNDVLLSNLAAAYSPKQYEDEEYTRFLANQYAKLQNDYFDSDKEHEYDLTDAQIADYKSQTNKRNSGGTGYSGGGGTGYSGGEVFYPETFETPVQQFGISPAAEKPYLFNPLYW